MPVIQIDFSQVEDTAFEAIPDGSYPVSIEKVEMRMGKTSGEPYLNWELVTLEGEFENRHLWMMTSLSQKALWRLKAVFSNLGVLEDEMEIEVDEATNFVTTPELAGLTAVAVVITEVYEGKARNRVEDLLAYDDAPAKKAPALKVKQSVAKPAAKGAVSKQPAKKSAVRLK